MKFNVVHVLTAGEGAEDTRSREEKPGKEEGQCSRYAGTTRAGSDGE